MLSEVQSKCGVRGRTELHEWVSTMNRNKDPAEGRQACPRRGGKTAERQPQAVAIMGEVRLVGESDIDFPWC